MSHKLLGLQNSKINRVCLCCEQSNWYTRVLGASGDSFGRQPPWLSHRPPGTRDSICRWAWPLENRAKHQFSPPTHQQLQEGLTLFANPENYYFLSSKTLRGKKPASPRNPNPRGRASENSHTENREGTIQRQPDLLKANTHHQLHFC